MKLKTLAGAVLALALGTTAAMAEQFRLGLITPPPHQWTKSAEVIAERLKTETEGRVELLIFPSGQLGNEAQMLQQLQTGAVDFAFLTLGELANRDQDYGIFLAPYLVDDVAGARELLKGEVAGQLLTGVNKFGLQGLGWGMAGMREIVMKGAVASVADLSGRKIRTVPFAQELDFWTKVGAAPTPMPLPALYDAFANGQVDGMQIDFEGTWNSKYYDHAGAIVHSDHMMFPMIAVASGRKWQAMPEADREIVARVMAEEIDTMIGLYAEIDAKYLADLQGTKVPVVRADRAFFGPAIDRWYEEWRVKTPILVDLEAEAAAIKSAGRRRLCAPPAPPGRITMTIAYRDLRYLRIHTPDLDAAHAFAAQVFGLQAGDRDDHNARFRSDARNYALCCSTQPGQAVALTVARPEDLDRAEARLADWSPRRLTAEDCAERQVKSGLAVVAPNGVTVELVWRPMTSGWRYHGTRDAGITGFQAVQLACRDIAANEDFWTRGLGALVTDWAGDAAFLAIDDAHHRIALYPSARDGVLGATWAVETINNVMQGWYFFQNSQTPIIHGPGRQPTSGAVFVTARGPGDIFFSYAAETEHGPQITARGPRQFANQTWSHDAWGSACHAAEFGGNAA